MKPSKLFITSLLAAAAMGTSAYATSLSDATLSIESFTQANIDALGSAGWTVSGITISGTDGTFTTTTGTQPSITAANGSSNTLSTAVSERYTFSTIVTVDASLFSGTGNGNIIAGSMAGESVSTTNDIGVGFSSGNITGVYSNVVWDDGRNRTLDVSDSIVNGKVTIGLVFTGGSGVNIYLADGSTANIAGLMTKTNYNAISLSDSTSVTYSNLYWFNTALSGADMQAAVVSATSTGTRQAALTWAGGTSGTWDYESDTNWTMPGESGTVSTAFQDWDGVTFATEGAQVELTQSVGSYWLKDLTVSAATSLTGTGTVRVDAANLTTNAVLTLDENVRLDLGTMTDTNNTVDLSGKLAGTGTIVLAKPDGDHGNVIRLGDDFSGILEYTGRIGQQNLPNVGAKTTLKLNNVWLWGTSAATINQKVIITGANGYIDRDSVTFAGETTIEGAFDVRTGGTLNISGKTTAATLKVSGGTLNISGDAEKTITTLTQSAGTLNVTAGTTTVGTYGGLRGQSVAGALTIAAGASMSVTGGMTLRWENENTTTLNVNGDLSVGGNLWISRDGNGIVNINDGGTVVAQTLTFGQGWNTTDPTKKSSTVNLESGGVLVVGAVVANTTAGASGATTSLNTSALNLNGGKLGTSADSLTINVTSGSGGTAKTLSVVLGDGTTSTINTGKYDTATKMFTKAEASISIVNAISGSGALKKDGAGTLTLSGANSFTGGLEIKEGIVVSTQTYSLGAGTNVVKLSGGQLSVNADVTLAQTNIEIALSSAYATTAAIIGAAATASLAVNTTVTITDLDLTGIALASEAALANSSYEFKILDTISAGENLTFKLSEELRNDWRISDYTDGVLTISAIPEPSVFGLLAGLGALALAGTRRRRRK